MHIKHTWRKLLRLRLFLILIGILSFLLLLIAAVGGVISGHGSLPPLRYTTAALSDSWQDQNGVEVSLPHQFYPHSSQAIYSIETTLPDSLRAGRLSLLLSAKYLNLHAYIDGKEIGHILCRPDGALKTTGKAYTALLLPEDAAGRTLRLEAEPLLDANVKYEFATPLIGTEGSLLYAVICSELPLLIIICAIFCFGLMQFLFGLRAHPIDSKEESSETFLPIGTFAVLFSAYSLSITDTIYFFVFNTSLLYLMEFLLLALLPFPLLVLVFHISLSKFYKPLLINIAALFANACLQVFFHFFTTLELRRTVLVTHTLILLTLVLFVPTLIMSCRTRRDSLWLVVSFSPVFIGSMADLVRFYFPNTLEKAIGFQLGVLIFILLQTLYLQHAYLRHYENNLLANMYRHLAYTDALTGAANRTAFEERVAELSDHPQRYTSIWCVCADINNLKWVNDNCGHDAGDELIRGAATALQALNYASAELYRTGGDEFYMFLLNLDEQDIADGVAQFNQVIGEHNTENSPWLSVAIGYDHLGSMPFDTIEKLIQRTDALMYENKRRWKQSNAVVNSAGSPPSTTTP